MTVETQAMTTHYAYSASGEYPVAFPVIRVSDVKVSVLAADGEEKPLIPGSHFEVLERESGYAVVLADGAPVSVADTVLVYRQVPMTQELDLIGPGGAFNEKDIETAFDKLTMVDQQMQAVLGRSLSFPLSDAGSSPATLPNAAGRSGKIIGFNDEGALTMYAASTTATPESTYSKNVVDYGADPTGEADSTAAIMAAMAAIGTTRGLVYFPPGTYKVSRTAGEDHCLLVGSNVTMYGRNACLKLDVSACGTTAGDEVMMVKIADNATDVVFEGLEFDGQMESTGTYVEGDAVRWRDSSAPSTWDGTHIYNYAIWTNGSCERITVKDCRIHDFGGDGIKVWDGNVDSPSPGWRIINCNIHDLTGAGIAFSSRVRNSTIQGCHIYQVARCCIGLEQAEYVAVAGNWLANPGYGMLGQPAECITGYGTYNKHILVANNIMRDTWRGATHLAGDYITITGNHCYNCGGVGLYVDCNPGEGSALGKETNYSVVIDGNTVEHCGHNGYHAGASGTMNGWSNSNAYVTYATPGIYVEHALGTVISNNTIRFQGISACGSWISEYGGCGISLRGGHDSYVEVVQESQGDGSTSTFAMTFNGSTPSVYLRATDGTETLQTSGYTLSGSVAGASCTFDAAPSATQTVVFKMERDRKSGNRNIVQGNTVLSIFGGDQDHDGVVDYIAGEGPGDGMLLEGVRDSIISDNVFGALDGYGVRIYSRLVEMQDDAETGYYCEATGNLFKGNRIHDAGLDGVFATNISDTTFDGNMIVACGNHAIHIHMSDSFKRDVGAHDMRTWGTTRVHSSGLVFQGNTLKDNVDCGIYCIFGGLGVLATATELHAPQIQGNRITGNGDKGVELIPYEDTDILEGLLVNGNRINGNGAHALHLPSLDLFTIANNVLMDNGGCGINLYPNENHDCPQHGTITGNTIQGNTGRGVQYLPVGTEMPYYIRFCGNYIKSHVEGNLYSPNGWGTCTFAGNDTIPSVVQAGSGAIDLTTSLDDQQLVEIGGGGTVTSINGSRQGRFLRFRGTGSGVTFQHASGVLELGGSNVAVTAGAVLELVNSNGAWYKVN